MVASIFIRGSTLTLPHMEEFSSLAILSILLNWAGLYLTFSENDKSSRNYPLGAGIAPPLLDPH